MKIMLPEIQKRDLYIQELTSKYTQALQKLQETVALLEDTSEKAVADIASLKSGEINRDKYEREWIARVSEKIENLCDNWCMIDLNGNRITYNFKEMTEKLVRELEDRYHFNFEKAFGAYAQKYGTDYKPTYIDVLATYPDLAQVFESYVNEQCRDFEGEDYDKED